MSAKTILCIILLLNNVILSFCSFALPIGILGALSSALYASFGKLACNFYECCPENQDINIWVPRNLTGLKEALEEKVHGQHLVNNVVLKALLAHYSDPSPHKALVISFHGWIGSGKNHVARIIAENIYKKGLKSKYVHFFSSTLQFPHEEKVDIYKLQIQDWIRGNASQCQYSLFIFDEIDKMPIGMIDAIKPFIDYHEEIFGINFRKSVFIFLSNTGSREINKKVLENWREGKSRHDITLQEMEELVLKGAFNEQGGLHNSELIEHSLVDYYIPFLPLEKTHIYKCIIDEYKRRRVKPTKDLIEKVMDSLSYFPPGTNLYSTTGCKKIPQKIGYFKSDVEFDLIFG